ncbi:MAG: minor capsid protein [Clostridia bacterium]|nr:minor capsid protein [Clostridia bacterium]
MNVLNANKINAWVEKKLNLPFTIYNDMIPDTTAPAACLRYDPAPAAERRFNDGSRLLKWNLTFYIRHKDRAKARAFAYDITAALDGTVIPDEENGTEYNCEALTLPQFISIDDKNNTVYSAAIEVYYMARGNMEE